MGLPPYKDYIVRTKVAKDFDLVVHAKTGISSFYAINHRLPTSNREAGMDDVSVANFQLYIGNFDSYNATIIRMYGTIEIPELDGWEILVFDATEKNGRLI